MSNAKRRLTITELEQETALRRSTIYHYQKKGLLPAVERAGGSPANYRDEHLDRLLQIKALKEAGLTLHEIETRLEPAKDAPPTDRTEIAAEHAETVRASIVEAASRVFASKGYLRGTIREVCRVAGMTPKTFYHYFASKHELFLEVGRSVVEQWLSVTEPHVLAEPDPVKRYLMQLSGYLGITSIIPDLLVFLKAQAQGGDESSQRVLESIYQAFVDTLIADLRALRTDAQTPPHDDEMMVYGIIGAAQDSALKLAWDDRYTPEDYLRMQLQLCLAIRGLYVGQVGVDEDRRAELEQFIDDLVANPPLGRRNPNGSL